MRGGAISGVVVCFYGFFVLMSVLVLLLCRGVRGFSDF